MNVSENPIVNEVKRQLKQINQLKKIIVGLSGGIDSVVVLHVLYSLQLPYEILALHVNHHLQPEAEKWAQFCQRFCQTLKIKCLIENINLPSRTNNLEAHARNARYQCMAVYVDKGSALVTAHHQNDQAETMLLQLLRGAGPAGLGAMPAQKKFSQGLHLRPLLNCTRAEIESYAKQYRLTWIEDSSNLQSHFARNFIRHEVMPQLKERWPGVLKTLSRAAEHQANAQQLLDELARIDFQQIKTKSTTIINLTPLLLLNRKRQKNLLRYWLKKKHVLLPSEKKLQTMVQQINQAKADKNPSLVWHEYILKRYQQQLYLLRQGDEIKLTQTFAWDLQELLRLPEPAGILKAGKKMGQGFQLKQSPVTVRFRQGGEVMHIKNRGHRCLKKLMQEWQIPPWQRQQVPLIFAGEELICVVGYAIAVDWCVDENEQGWFIQRAVIP